MANNFLIKSMVSGFLPMLPDALKQLDSVISKSLTEQPLQGTEASAAFVLVSGKDGRAYILTAFFDEEDKIVRTGEQQLATEFLQQLIKNSI